MACKVSHDSQLTLSHQVRVPGQNAEKFAERIVHLQYPKKYPVTDLSGWDVGQCDQGLTDRNVLQKVNFLQIYKKLDDLIMNVQHVHTYTHKNKDTHMCLCLCLCPGLTSRKTASTLWTHSAPGGMWHWPTPPSQTASYTRSWQMGQRTGDR